MRMDCDQGKLFVGGISFETTEETLKDHFSKYGDVVDTVIMKDRVSGHARGFGFVLFSDPSSADKALQDHHLILSRTVEVKKALPRRGKHQFSNKKNYSNNQFQHLKTKKIFVGGLAATVTEEEFKTYFDKFGKITDVVVMYDNVTHRARGFGFITFDSEVAVESVMQQPFHMLNNKSVEVKRAVPKDGSGSFSNSTGNNSTCSNTADNGVGGAGVGSIFGQYQGNIFPTYGPRYNVFTGYVPPPISGYPYGAYPIGGYGGVCYGPAPIFTPRSPWTGPGMVGVRRSPAPYGNSPYHPGYLNGVVGGYMGMVTGDYNGIMGSTTNGKWNQDNTCDTQLVAVTSQLRLDGGKSNDESSGNVGSYGGFVSKQNQSGPDGQLKPCTVDDSS